MLTDWLVNQANRINWVTLAMFFIIAMVMIFGAVWQGMAYSRLEQRVDYLTTYIAIHEYQFTKTFLETASDSAIVDRHMLYDMDELAYSYVAEEVMYERAIRETKADSSKKEQ